MTDLTNLLMFGLLVIVGTFAYGAWRAAPWVPTWKRDLKRMVDLAEIQPGERMYDLGCGDGRLVLAAADRGARAVGYEVALLPYWVAKLRALRYPNERAAIRFGDFWWTDVSDADLVYFFLTPKANPRMKTKLEKELKPGARVVAYVWPIEGWEPAAESHAEGQPSIYLYRM
jgi:SAM-dependent methyltransferase